MKSRVSFPIRAVKMAGAVCLATFALTIGSTTARAGSDGITPNVQPTPPPSFWNQQYMLGDWGGERTALAKEGVSFDFNDIGDFLTDVSGSQTHHATYFGRFRASMDIDFSKLSGFDGEFFFSGIWQYGRNLSGD